jgi:hypothetical protein
VAGASTRHRGAHQSPPRGRLDQPVLLDELAPTTADVEPGEPIELAPAGAPRAGDRALLHKGGRTAG